MTKLDYILAFLVIIVGGILGCVMTIFIVRAAIYFDKPSILWFLFLPLIATSHRFRFKNEDGTDISDN